MLPQSYASFTLTAEQLLAKLAPGGPRLLIGTGGFDALKRRVEQSPVLQQWTAWLRERAAELAPGPVIRDSPIVTSMPSRMLMERLLTLALSYRLTGEPAMLQQIERELASLIEDEAFIWYGKTPGRYVLNTGEAAVACSVALNWLAEDLDPGLRERVLTAVKARVLDSAKREYADPAGNRWPTRNNNWSQVCNGGVIVASLALAERCPELCAELITTAVRSLPLAMAEFAPDGAWEEGPMYWRYGVMWNIILLSALDTMLGDMFGLDEAPGLADTGEYYLQTCGPTYAVFNYSDCGQAALVSPQLLWLARRFNRPDLAAGERRLAQRLARGDLPTGTTHEHGLQGKSIHPLDILWWDPAWDQVTEGERPLDRHYRKSEVALMRSDWDDENALFVGFKGGRGRRAHAHLDAGSFVLDALGVRWALDLGGEAYSSPGYFETWDGSSYRHFMYYRTRPEGHNTLVINPHVQPQQAIDATAPILRSRSDADHAMAICDLSAVYHRQAASVLRGVALIDGRSRVLVQDEVHSDRAVDYWSFMHTRAEITIAEDQRSAVLKLDGRELHALLLGDAAATLQVMDARPMVHSPDPPGQSNNAGVRKLVVRHEVAVNPTVALLLTPTVAERPSPRAADHPLTPLAAWA